MSLEDCPALWYSSREIWQFRRQANQAVANLQTKSTTGTIEQHSHCHWAQSMADAYREFCQCKELEEENDDEEEEQQRDDIDNTGTTTFVAPDSSLDTDTTLGLERRAIPGVWADTKSRRQYLMDQVLHLQNSPLYLYDEEMQNRVMGEASRHCSYPSRLYARHVAMMLAAREEEEEEENE
eukprot:scaffold1276_cov162-Amphora_coffeaeformis.AAC.11